ncbi:helix-turn-helix transcriptional regulator [Mucilaginibacter pallidiroseus]|uniref:Helix-turn-helix transcriptional regulator n=1 Tax=Mucilaginibacter pallidiroseus TaxID=2599295 RepID=A0A563U5A0_9SPHI|nr:helix-turn-helix transcriptional regulator [Mucilaginibacter pallidiroseus]TWR26505.1 helix-turn-helix transcriptional regulator [Mucilaginibacter pallidiroseus]
MSFEPIPFTPKSPELQKHISYFYFLSTDDNFDTSYYAFPHVNTVLNIHQRANFEIKDYYTRVYGDTQTRYAACVQGIREYPLLAHLHGRLNKVTILFRPLGINQFGIENFGAKYGQPSMVFNSWDTNPLYHDFLAAFYNTESITSRCEILETFLLKIYQPIAAHTALFKAIEMLNDVENDISVDEISTELGYNIRTFNRVFKKALGVSPVAYRKVARFRHSLQNRMLSASLKKLTDIAYQSNYYDQAYFNKIYRSLTGTNPQRFFDKIDSFADDRLIFEFMTR